MRRRSWPEQVTKDRPAARGCGMPAPSGPNSVPGPPVLGAGVPTPLRERY
jgi:hypothetical protein